MTGFQISTPLTSEMVTPKAVSIDDATAIFVAGGACVIGSSYHLSPEVTDWLDDPENITGQWSFDFDAVKGPWGVCAYNPRIAFNDEADAALFKLR